MKKIRVTISIGENKHLDQNRLKSALPQNGNGNTQAASLTKKIRAKRETEVFSSILIGM